MEKYIIKKNALGFQVKLESKMMKIHTALKYFCDALEKDDFRYVERFSDGTIRITCAKLTVAIADYNDVKKNNIFLEIDEIVENSPNYIVNHPYVSRDNENTIIQKGKGKRGKLSLISQNFISQKEKQKEIEYEEPGIQNRELKTEKEYENATNKIELLHAKKVYMTAVKEISPMFGLDPKLVLGIILREIDGKERLLGRAGIMNIEIGKWANKTFQR